MRRYVTMKMCGMQWAIAVDAHYTGRWLVYPWTSYRIRFDNDNREERI